jgi:hypothetical protein
VTFDYAPSLIWKPGRECQCFVSRATSDLRIILWAMFQSLGKCCSASHCQLVALRVLILLHSNVSSVRTMAIEPALPVWKQFPLFLLDWSFLGASCVLGAWTHLEAFTATRLAPPLGRNVLIGSLTVRVDIYEFDCTCRYLWVWLYVSIFVNTCRPCFNWVWKHSGI